jgi:DNA-directed RNA polymerase subunit RPC12/RpoP
MAEITINLRCKRCERDYPANLKAANEERKLVCPHCNKPSLYSLRELVSAYQVANAPK